MFNPNVVVKNIVNQANTDATLAVIARVLMAYIFIVAGWGKLTAYSATVGYMESMGVPSAMLPLTILVELGGGTGVTPWFSSSLCSIRFRYF